MKNILLQLFLFCTLFCTLCSCESDAHPQKTVDLRIPPAGYECFSKCKYADSHYRVWSECKDTILGFNIKALMVAWINESYLKSTTSFILSHKSGKTFELEGEDISLLSLEDFRHFVNNNHKTHNDTIVDFNYEYEPPKTDVFYVETWVNKPFLFLDVTFDGRKALLIRKEDKRRPNEFQIYSLGLNLDTIREINYEPYNQFDQRTEINYINESITVYSQAPDAPEGYVNQIKDTYTLKRQIGKFVKYREYNLVEI